MEVANRDQTALQATTVGEGQLTIADEPREDQHSLHLMRDLEEPLDLDHERTNIHSICLAHYDEIDPC